MEPQKKPSIPLTGGQGVSRPVGSSKQASPTFKTTRCAIARKRFVEKAKPLRVQVGDDVSVVAAPKENKTGSFGWNSAEKQTFIVDGVAIKCQVSVNVTVIGSKDV